ncbi:c-type cytochrome biogenesis protein CcsB [Massilia sp. 9096]|uniref:c-type cytochrome biogenesis protein CcsB n=1 Tax=Massilia sp. 9096 TaxID=1500894 RepID=UPI000691404E|nr:c-type cytochrome biogenesis protein CcsB [Massilia sp. 9096]
MDISQTTTPQGGASKPASQPVGQQVYVQPRGYFQRLGMLDWLYGIGLFAAMLFALNRFGGYMDYYEKAILVLAAPVFTALGWGWKPVRWLIPLIAVLALCGVASYGGSLDAANQKFVLKYMLSSQSAILWMSALFVFSTAFYWLGLLARSPFGGSVGSKLCWAAVVLGFTGMMVRWYESYLIGADVGHIPVSNLYEVFILFSMITALFYLYYEQRYRTRALGPFVLLVISAAVGFLLWYTVARDAAEIQPLVPALQSWWMKIHVPANFIGYGTFALAAAVGSAYLLKSYGILADRLPALEVLDDVMYKSISVGFAFFTVATILGALWAAEAWGGYWSWDPKETWALIVWLNYAAWLHMRLVSGLRGRPAAWWALIGLVVTTFAFLGVNMFLSGLHSYGKL